MKQKLTLLLCVLFACMTFMRAQTGTFGTNLQWNLNGGILTVSNTTAISEPVPDNYSWGFSLSGITDLIINDSVTGIGSYAFAGFPDLATVSLSADVQDIGDAAFKDCVTLDSIDLSHIVTIGDSSFFNCSNLTSVELDEGLRIIGENAFMDCSSLASITIPASDTAIYSKAFFNCSSLDTVRVKWTDPADIPDITSNDVFGGATPAATLVIPAGTYAYYMAANIWQDFAMKEDLSPVRALIENEAYTAIPQDTANTQSAVVAWLTDYINDLLTNNGVSYTVAAADIIVSNFSSAVTGGSDGSFNFVINLASTVGIGSSATTAQKQINITATAVYAITISPLSNGAVTPDKTSAPFGETVTLTIVSDAGYELDDLDVYETGAPANVITVIDSTFVMPAADVTVAATFKKTAARITLEAVKDLIADTTFTVAQDTANTAIEVKSWLFARINSLIAISGKTATVDSIIVVSVTSAAAGTSSNRYGISGSFSFRVALSKGADTLTTPPMNGIIAAKPAYNITVPNNILHGSVTADKAYTAAGDSITLTITPAVGYELTSLEVRTDSNQPVSLNGYRFKMPAQNVTVSATFTEIPVIPDPDWSAVQDAAALISVQNFVVLQAQANTEATVAAWLSARITSILQDNGNDCSVGSITFDAFTPAIFGTEYSINGTNGSFMFSVSFIKGSYFKRLYYHNGTITAKPYNVANESIDLPQLKAYSANGHLHIAGLRSGEVLAVYSVSGSLVYKGIANETEVLLPLTAKGVYIIVAGGERNLKVVHN